MQGLRRSQGSQGSPKPQRDLGHRPATALRTLSAPSLTCNRRRSRRPRPGLPRPASSAPALQAPGPSLPPAARVPGSPDQSSHTPAPLQPRSSASPSPPASSTERVTPSRRHRAAPLPGSSPRKARHHGDGARADGR